MYDKKIKKILAEVKRKRLKSEYTQKYVAEQLGITQNLYSKLEQGQIKITACKFSAVCDVLEIDPRELLGPC